MCWAAFILITFSSVQALIKDLTGLSPLYLVFYVTVVVFLIVILGCFTGKDWFAMVKSVISMVLCLTLLCCLVYLMYVG